jgi:hypothetical protein
MPCFEVGVTIVGVEGAVGCSSIPLANVVGTAAVVPGCGSAGIEALLACD